ncbi:MAG: CapA family protein [Caldilineaceae bacterium]|nr:CapA family protein [Caldilineaceae bacterium]
MNALHRRSPSTQPTAALAARITQIGILTLLVSLLLVFHKPALAAPTPQASGSDWVTISIDSNLPERYYNRLLSLLVYRVKILDTDTGPKQVLLLDKTNHSDAVVGLYPLSQVADSAIYTRYYAPVGDFATVADDVALEELAKRWQGEGDGPLVVGKDYQAELSVLLGGKMAASVIVTGTQGILPAVESDPNAIGIVPFDRLNPRFKVFSVDGVSVLDNRLDGNSYGLAAAVGIKGEEAPRLAGALTPLVTNSNNRDAGHITTLIMTGVTAMTRVTALRMEQKGYDYPARVISETLAAADITHISNEVPFIEGCVVNASQDNLTMCSDTTYWAALEAVGTDIVGLSGNHVNDFGRDGARESIGWYRENGISIYGSGLNVDEACAPLLWEHNGNRFAFIAALAFGPAFAWATDELPGACYYYDHKEAIFETIADLRSQVDVIAVELQYLETYNPYPTDQQVLEFRELREQGVDIVTGVQSHVPQAFETYAAEGTHRPGVIVYGLGNLFFDQMWSWQTRTELMARHTIYRGRVISTEILTAVLEDYAQPRWATEPERADILRSIFQAAPTRPD